MMNKKKFVATLVAMVVGMLWLTGCEPTPQEPAKKLAVSVVTDQNLTTYPGQTLKFDLNITRGVAPYRYDWSENGQTFSAEAAPSYVIGDETPLGEHTVTVTVTDSENAEANATISFTVGQDPNRFKAVEEFFGLSDLKVGDSWYWNGNEWEMTEDDCDYNLSIRSDGKKQLDNTSIAVSKRKLHFTLVNTEADGDGLIGCSLHSYNSEIPPYEDMIIAEVKDGKITIDGISDHHSDPNDQGWLRTTEPLRNDRIYYDE